MFFFLSLFPAHATAVPHRGSRDVTRPYRSFSWHADIDECSGEHQCSHGCRNTDGSHACTCPEGLHLAPDLATCIGNQAGNFCALHRLGKKKPSLSGQTTGLFAVPSLRR